MSSPKLQKKKSAFLSYKDTFDVCVYVCRKKRCRVGSDNKIWDHKISKKPGTKGWQWKETQKENGKESREMRGTREEQMTGRGGKRMKILSFFIIKYKTRMQTNF